MSSADSGPFDRRRVLVQGAFGAASISASFVAHRFYLEPGFGLTHVNVITATLVMALTPFVMRWSES